MTDSGKYIELISQSFAVLKYTLEQNGQLGLTNGHKQCENLMRDLLNIVYNRKLYNLNDKSFPGLDLGSKKGFAYEIGASRSGPEIDEKLRIILKHEHYKRFPIIYFLMLTGKQQRYSLKTVTQPFFDFDWKTNIIDLDDILNDLKNFDKDRLKPIHELLGTELPALHQHLADIQHQVPSNFRRFLDSLFKAKPKSKTGDDYDMSKILWQSIRPPDSKFEHKSKMMDSIPGGSQFWSFEYGPTGHAFPLNLDGDFARAEIQFACRVNNAMKAIYAANDYAMNYLPPRFLIGARPILEAYTFDELRKQRSAAAKKILDQMIPVFDDGGFTLESVTIGAIDRLILSETSTDQPVAPNSKPIVLFYNSTLTYNGSYNVVAGMPLVTDKEKQRFLCMFPFGLSNESEIDTENISVIFKYMSDSPLPLSDKISRLVDKSYIMPVQRRFYKEEDKQCSTYQIPFIKRATLVLIGELIHMFPTTMTFDLPDKTPEGDDIIRRFTTQAHFFFEVIVLFKNCPSRHFKFNIQFIEAESYQALIDIVLGQVKHQKENDSEHIVYMPDFKRHYQKAKATLDIGKFNNNQFCIISKKGSSIQINKINQNDNVVEL